MLNPLFNSEDVKRLDAIYKKLAQLPNTEASFLHIESLFYDVLAIARNYEGTNFSMELRELQLGMYKGAQEKNLTPKMKDSAIRRFKNALRQAINAVIKVNKNMLA